MMYGIDIHVVESYDAREAYTSDIETTKELITDESSFKMLEPFCGIGWILIPLTKKDPQQLE